MSGANIDGEDEDDADSDPMRVRRPPATVWLKIFYRQQTSIVQINNSPDLTFDALKQQVIAAVSKSCADDPPQDVRLECLAEEDMQPFATIDDWHRAVYNYQRLERAHIHLFATEVVVPPPPKPQAEPIAESSVLFVPETAQEPALSEREPLVQQQVATEALLEQDPPPLEPLDVPEQQSPQHVPFEPPAPTAVPPAGIVELEVAQTARAFTPPPERQTFPEPVQAAVPPFPTPLAAPLLEYTQPDQRELEPVMGLPPADQQVEAPLPQPSPPAAELLLPPERAVSDFVSPPPSPPVVLESAPPVLVAPPVLKAHHPPVAAPPPPPKVALTSSSPAVETLVTSTEPSPSFNRRAEPEQRSEPPPIKPKVQPQHPSKAAKKVEEEPAPVPKEQASTLPAPTPKHAPAPAPHADIAAHLQHAPGWDPAFRATNIRNTELERGISLIDDRSKDNVERAETIRHIKVTHPVPPKPSMLPVPRKLENLGYSHQLYHNQQQQTSSPNKQQREQPPKTPERQVVAAPVPAPVHHDLVTSASQTTEYGMLTSVLKRPPPQTPHRVSFSPVGTKPPAPMLQDSAADARVAPLSQLRQPRMSTKGHVQPTAPLPSIPQQPMAVRRTLRGSSQGLNNMYGMPAIAEAEDEDDNVDGYTPAQPPAMLPGWTAQRYPYPSLRQDAAILSPLESGYSPIDSASAGLPRDMSPGYAYAMPSYLPTQMMQPPSYAAYPPSFSGNAYVSLPPIGFSSAPSPAAAELIVPAPLPPQGNSFMFLPPQQQQQQQAYGMRPSQELYQSPYQDTLRRPYTMQVPSVPTVYDPTMLTSRPYSMQELGAAVRQPSLAARSMQTIMPPPPPPLAVETGGYYDQHLLRSAMYGSVQQPVQPPPAMAARKLGVQDRNYTPRDGVRLPRLSAANLP
ncbi:hypothetical protein RI367_007190 [Sorochytrium milnesiophthora]